MVKYFVRFYCNSLIASFRPLFDLDQALLSSMLLLVCVKRDLIMSDIRHRYTLKKMFWN